MNLAVRGEAGIGMIGLPSDFTSPSRFVRAALMANNARIVADGREAIYEAFRIMDAFNVPVDPEDSVKAGKEKFRSATIWTIAHDLTNRTFYYHTSDDRMVQMVDVARIVFDQLAAPVHLKLDDGETTVRNRTGEVSKK